MTPTNFDPRPHLLQIKRHNKKTNTTTTTQYLPVQYRLQWFRTEHPSGKIDSKLVHLDTEKGIAVFETYVERQDGGSARMHGSETVQDWQDFIEKAQTKSLGRALAACGYGSQFTDSEFDEGERIVDSPVPMRQSSPIAQEPAAPTSEQAEQEKQDFEDMAAIKSDVRALGLAKDSEGWAKWKKSILKRNLADVDLTAVHLRMMRIAIEQERSARAANVA